MKKIVIVLLVFFAFSWISVVSAGNFPAKESPESIVTFSGGNGETISVISVPGTINVEQCTPWEDTHAPCIISLENQGCNIVNVIVTHNAIEGSVLNTAATYLLSCDGH